MKESVKTSLRAVALLLWLFASIVASAGAFTTKEGVYIVAGVGNIVGAILSIYSKIIKK